MRMAERSHVQPASLRLPSINYSYRILCETKDSAFQLSFTGLQNLALSEDEPTPTTPPPSTYNSPARQTIRLIAPQLNEKEAGT